MELELKAFTGTGAFLFVPGGKAVFMSLLTRHEFNLESDKKTEKSNSTAKTQTGRSQLMPPFIQKPRVDWLCSGFPVRHHKQLVTVTLLALLL